MRLLPSYLMLGAVLVVPLIYLNATIDPVSLPRFLLLSAILATAITALTITSIKERFPYDCSFIYRGIVPVMLGYAAVSALSLTSCAEVSEGIFELLRIVISFITFIVLTHISVNESGFRRQVSKAVTVSGACLSVIAVCQYFDVGFSWIPGNAGPYGTMANKNLLSSFLFLVIPFASYTCLKSRGLWRWFSSSTTAILLYVELISQTRAVWVALFVSTALTAVLVPRLWRLSLSRYVKPRIAIAALGAAFAVAAIAMFTLVLGKGGASHEANRLPINLSEQSLKQRLILWDKSVDIFLDHPVRGVGLGNWKIVSPAYGTEQLPSASGETVFLRPHNDFLWVLTEAGLPGLLLYITVFMCVVYYALSAARRTDSEDDAVLMMTMVFGVIGYLVISFFSFPRERIAHGLLLMLIASLITSVYHKQCPLTRSDGRRLLNFVYILSLLGIAFSVLVGAYRFNAEVHTKRAAAAGAMGNWKSVISEVDVAMSPFSRLDPTSTPLALYKGEAYVALGDTDAALMEFRRATVLNQYHIRSLNNLATCHEKKGEHESALEYYTRVLAISPHLEQTWLNVAAVYYNMGRYSDARSALLEVKGKPTDPRYHEYLRLIDAKLKP